MTVLPGTLDMVPSTLDMVPSTLDMEPSTLDPRLLYKLEFVCDRLDGVWKVEAREPRKLRDLTFDVGAEVGEILQLDNFGFAEGRRFLHSFQEGISDDCRASEASLQFRPQSGQQRDGVLLLSSPEIVNNPLNVTACELPEVIDFLCRGHVGVCYHRLESGFPRVK